MNLEELKTTLTEKGFEEQEQDTGIQFTLTDGHIELTCYIEPAVEVEFISLYRWKNNDVKGTYNVTAKELPLTKDTVLTMFRKTKNNMPEYVGETNVHTEVDAVLEKIF